MKTLPQPGLLFDRRCTSDARAYVNYAPVLCDSMPYEKKRSTHGGDLVFTLIDGSYPPWMSQDARSTLGMAGMVAHLEGTISPSGTTSPLSNSSGDFISADATVRMAMLKCSAGNFLYAHLVLEGGQPACMALHPLHHYPSPQVSQVASLTSHDVKVRPRNGNFTEADLLSCSLSWRGKDPAFLYLEGFVGMIGNNGTHLQVDKWSDVDIFMGKSAMVLKGASPICRPYNPNIPTLMLAGELIV